MSSLDRYSEKGKAAQIDRQNDWIKKNRDKITVIFPAGTLDRIKAAAAAADLSQNAFCSAAIIAALEQIENK